MPDLPRLFGDGQRDDYPAIQTMLDAGRSEVFLPAPENCYVISRTLKIHGGQTLKMSPYTVIRLLPQSNCAMLEDSDFAAEKRNICVDGGIWDMDNAHQQANPWHFPDENGETSYDQLKKIGYTFREADVLPPVYTGFCMRFSRVDGFFMKNVTFRNPVTYGVQVSYMTHFTFSDISFDYNHGAPKLWNMDGIHIEGNCRFGYLRNLQGACHDDLVSITADDGGPYGPISDIIVDGIFAEHCHSAVRLLSHGCPVKNIKISNVYGSYYVYCIGLTRYYAEDDHGYMENIVIENVAACASEGTPDVEGGRNPLIWVQQGLVVDGLSIQNVSRVEKTRTVPTVGVDEGAEISRLVLKNIALVNQTGEDIRPISLDGSIGHLTAADLYVNGQAMFCREAGKR